MIELADTTVWGRRHLAPIRPHPLGRLGDAERVPGLERSQLVCEAPPDGVVERHEAVGDLGYAPSGVGEALAEERPDQAPRPVVLPHQEAQPLR